MLLPPYVDAVQGARAADVIGYGNKRTVFGSMQAQGGAFDPKGACSPSALTLGWKVPEPAWSRMQCACRRSR